MDVYFKNCHFEHIQKGLRWLKSDIKYDREKIRQEIYKIKKNDSKYSKGCSEKPEEKLKLKYVPGDILPVCVLSLVNDPIIEEFRKSTETEEFWCDSNSDFIFQPTESYFFCVYFFHEMGFSSNRYFLNYFQEYKKALTVEGKFWNSEDHVCFLRLAIALEPHSRITKSALEYSLQNGYHLLEPFESSIFILSLMELDYSKYIETIEEGINFIKSRQNRDGSWISGSFGEIYRDTYFAIKAICRINGNNDDHVKRGVEFILKNQHQKGCWGYVKKVGDKEEYIPPTDSTSFAILSLLSTCPPISISLEEYMFKNIQYEQRINLHKPYFVHTSPIYMKKLPVKEIYEKIKGGLENAKYDIRIISPYIDMHYEDIINLRSQNPKLTIKIITRPKKDIKGTRGRIGKNALDLLKIAIKGNLKTLDIIHSRLIIIDDQELIISSADLTREGLFDEFNAGIYTRDEETIKKGIDYFENIWQELIEENGDNISKIP